jgi:hypothetical protein
MSIVRYAMRVTMWQPLFCLFTLNVEPVSFFILVALQRMVVSLITFGKMMASPISSDLMLPDTLIPVFRVNFVISANCYIFTM